MIRFLLLGLLVTGTLSAQTSLNGTVTDESGAVVPGAAVTAVGPGGIRRTTSGRDGIYSFTGLAVASYQVSATAPQMATPQPVRVELQVGSNTLALSLKLIASLQQLTVVSDAGPAVGTDSSNNASATVIKGADLDALSDDPQDLQADLEALAGPSAGPSGGAIFVDGFSGGQLPPKESIREIRINSNPFAAEFDKLGYGRIEIFTKPGSDKFHATVGYNLGTDRWNSRNPYAAEKAPFLLQETENSFSGPLTKRSSFTLDFERQAVDNGSVTNAVTLDPNSLAPVAFSSVLKTPQRHTLAGPHVDYQLTANNTLSLRYLYTRASLRDAGVGSFDLISRGYRILHTFHTVQAIETFIHGNTVNEFRFQYFRSDQHSTANTTGAQIQVLGSFNGGGASIANGSDLLNNFEVQDYASVLHGRNFVKFGARLRGQMELSASPSNFSGAFTFAGGLAPQLDVNGQPALDPAGQPVLIRIASIEQYRRTLLFQRLGYAAGQIRALGGGASQFTISGGTPESAVGQTDIGLFAGDDWRLRPNLSFSFGLRYETQTNIHDWHDFAPRAAFAWAPGSNGNKPGKTVIRGGFGMFYDRFSLAGTLAAARYDGLTQQQYTVTNPDFYPSVPGLAALAASLSPQTKQIVDARLRAPYLMQSALTLERQLPKSTTLALTYTNSHGLHILRSQYAAGSAGPVFLATSTGIYNQNQFVANVNAKMNPAVSLFGFYVFNRALSSSDGLATFPANPADFAGEYGPAATDVRHRVLIGGTLNLRWNLRLNPLITAQTGPPFNLTTGQDNYGTTLFTARPGFATGAARPGLLLTDYGLLDPDPIAGERLVPRNYGRGPGSILVNLRFGKTWGFGPEKGAGGGAVRSSRGGGGQTAGPALSVPQGNGGLFTQPSTPRRYMLTVSMSGRNLLNHTNPGPIIGNISSPLFGRANQVAGTPNGEGFSENASNRRLELQIRFTY